ncbi:MAG: DUF3500 domain-containing protein [Pirellulales bacterium]
MSNRPRHCPDCAERPETNRRVFLKNSAAAGAVAAGLATGIPAVAKEGKKQATSETLVQQFYSTLTEEQKKRCAFPFDHRLQSEVGANWHITRVRAGRDFTADQQALMREIFNSLHSEKYAKDVMRQVEQEGGFKGSSVALFGEPGTGKFEFVLTGRHVTRRCDGDSVEGTAFGGPIFYGHAAKGFNEAPDHPGNVYWFQAVRANELFQALDGKQRKVALQSDPRGEDGTETVRLKGKDGKLRGLPVSEMSDDQTKLARSVMNDLLAPFREVDRVESMKLVEKNGFDKLHFSYFKNMDIGKDGVWDVWQVEGPHMVWYFRGSPHVHTWVHIADGAKT